MNLYTYLPIVELLLLNSIYSRECIFLFVFALLLGRKCIVIPHGMLSFQPARFSLSSKYFKFLIKRSYLAFLSFSSRFLIATSELEESHLSSIAQDSSRVVVVSPSSLYLPTLSSSRYFDPKLPHKSQSHFTIFSAGRITPSKGSEILFDVFKKLAFSYPNTFRLIVLGPVSSSSRVKQSSFDIHGSPVYIVDEVYDTQLFESLACVSDVFLSCSPSESFGMCIYEAISFGLPAICSLGTPWQFLSGSNAGLCVQHNISSYIDAVLYFRNLPLSVRRSLADNCFDLSAKMNKVNSISASLVFDL